MAKVRNPIIRTTPVIADTIFVETVQPADIILSSTQVELKGSKIKIFGNTKNLLATFDSKTSTFTVRKRLVVGQINIGSKLKELETRIKKLEP